MRLRRHLLQALFWGGFTALMVILTLGYAGRMSGPLFIMVAVGLGLWACSEWLRQVVLRRSWLALGLPALGARLVLAILLLAVALQVVLYLVIHALLRLDWISMPAGRADYRPAAVLGYVFNAALMLTVWSAIWLGTTFWRRARRSELRNAQDEARRQRLELDALKARLNPHFVFNALNNLRALILEEPQRARDLVTRLSNTLRYALYHSQREAVTLAEELAVVDDYLAIEAVHYEQRLQLTRAIEPAAMSAVLPPMLLQLLVENAIKHGIARTPGGGVLALAAHRDNAGSLHIEVHNPGRLRAAPAGGSGEASGVGLAYLRTRLGQHWPGATLELRQRPGTPETVSASLRLPQDGIRPCVP